MNTRIAQLQREMAGPGLDLLVLRLPENIVLTGGYWPRNGFTFAVVPREGEPCLVVPRAEMADAETGTIPALHPFGWVDLREGDPFENIAAIFRRLAGQYGITASSTIGVEWQPTAVAPPLCAAELLLPGEPTYALIREGFGCGNLVPANGVYETARAIKTDHDIARLQTANKITREGIRLFEQVIEEPGAREIDVAAEVERHIAKFACGFEGVRHARAWAQISSGARTADAWFCGIVSGGRALQRRDFVMLEIAVAADGYWCDMTQTSCVGGMDGEKAEMVSAVVQAQNDAIMAVCAGVPAARVDQVARGVLERAGYAQHFIHGTGHGVGFSYHDGAPALTPTSKDVLRAGMVHSVEPGVYIPGVGGVRMEANVLVRQDGYTVLGL